MTASNWAAALAFAWRPENDGQPYHVDAKDPGEGTAWGVTQLTWASAQQAGVAPAGVALADATQDQLSAVLQVMTWNAVCADQMPDGVDLVLFDISMLSGAGRAARILQACVGTTQDGIIGPVTRRAAFVADPETLIRKLTSLDEAFFASLQTFTYFGRGWDRRAEDAQALALSLAGLLAAA